MKIKLKKNISGDDILPIIARVYLVAFRARIAFFNTDVTNPMHGTGYELEVRFHDSMISYLSKEGNVWGGTATFARVPQRVV